MKILVTGGSGTIGGYVLRELIEHGHSVTDYSRNLPAVEGVGFVGGDVMDLDRLSLAVRGSDAVVHLAGVPGPGRARPEQLLSTNVLGTVHVLEAVIRTGTNKMVLASSAAATGFGFQVGVLTPRYLPVDEEHPCSPHDEYGLSKLLAELACRRYSEAYGLATVCLRLNNNWYLDRDGASVVVRSGWAKTMTVEELWTARYKKCLEADGATTWPRPGPPRPEDVLWAFTDARDAAQAVRLAVEQATTGHEVLFINGDETCSMQDTPSLVARYFPTVPLKVKLEGHASLFSHDKATNLIGYRPRYTWRKSDFWAWMRSSE